MRAGDLLRDLGDELVAECLAEIGRNAATESKADHVFASAAWTAIAEPGDAVAGRLRRLVGSMEALRCLRSASDLAEALRDPGEIEPESTDVAQALGRWSLRLTTERIVAAFRSAGSLGAGLVVPGDAEWPRGVDDFGDRAPAALWTRGRPGILARMPSVAIVGCRASTAYGDDVAGDLAASLADRGFAVVSGGAYGIDGAAHRATLASGGATVAVLAGGVDRFYPSGHSELLGRVVAEGAVISEVPCGVPPTKWRFLQRNRVIAAAAAVSVVVEAGARSGALNTANHAHEIGRPVGAVPGPVTSPSSAGCHRLIRSTPATCITGVNDVIELVAPRWTIDTVASRPVARRPPAEARVLDALRRRAGRRGDEIAVLSGLSEVDVAGTLAVLELAGTVEERHDGWIRHGDAFRD